MSVFTTFILLGLTGPLFALAAGPAPVSLGSAGGFVLLSKTGISTTGATSVVGDIGVSPVSATSITGFALTLPATGTFSTSEIVTGKVYAPGYADPTPANLTTAVLDMQTAYTDAAGRAAGVTELGAGNIGGLTIAHGVYKWGTGVTIPTDVTLSGSAEDTWIFQIAQNLSVSSSVKIILAGGAQPGNIFWQVAGQTTIGTGAVFNGIILNQTAIVLNTGAELHGRALAQTAITLDANSVTAPSENSGSGGTNTSSTQTSATPVTPAIPAIPATSASVTGTVATPATPATPAVPPTVSVTDALQDQLNRLVETAQGLRMQLEARKQATAQNAFSNSMSTHQVLDISENLEKGKKGSHVGSLQRFLIARHAGHAGEALARVGATSYFGVLTKAALAEFQAHVGINPSLGYFGPITREYLRTH